MSYATQLGAGASSPRAGIRAIPRPRPQPDPAGMPPHAPGNAAIRKAASAAAALLAIVLAATLAAAPAAVATTGTTSNASAGMVYYYGQAQMSSTHYVHKLGDELVYCVDPYQHFETGVTLTGQDPVKTGKLSQECVTDLALAWRYVWVEDLYRTPAGDKLASDNERYAAAQVLIWTILKQYYPSLGPTHNRITVGGREVTGDGTDGANNKAALTWVASQRGKCVGHCEYFYAGGKQDFAMKFECEGFSGGIELRKKSSNSDMTKGNACYSLKGAEYGIYSDGACKKLVDTLVTDEAGAAHADDIPAGTYYVKETKAPKGYALDTYVYVVEVESDKTAKVNGADGLADSPQSNDIDLVALKADAQTADGSPQGSATLEGAQFTVAYYDGYYKAGSLPSSPTRTWVLATDKDGRARADKEHLVKGDAFYYSAQGKVALPLGTVTVRETKAPAGYLLGDAKTSVIQIKADSQASARVTSFEPARAGDDVQRGGVAVGKVDRQNGTYVPQGAAKLDGVTFEIVTNNSRHVIVDGVEYVKGAVVKTIQTQLANGRYVAQTDARCLPVGSYTVREAAVAEGYLFDKESKAWKADFAIASDGEVVDLTDPGSAAGNQVVRGDFEFSKVDGQTAERLGSVAFMVESLTTGERHVLVTDENGMVSTAASWNPHTAKTNANDAAVTATGEGFRVDDSKLDSGAGIWFDGSMQAACDPDDGLGALPYDTYSVSELRSKANEGLDLVSFTTVISRNERELDLGTVDDGAGPAIGTTLADSNGAKLVAADTAATLVDTVSYMNLKPKHAYRLEGELHAIDASGEDLGAVSQAGVEFSPGVSTGSAEVVFGFDPSEYDAARYVAFEKLFDEAGSLVAEHADPDDAAQTVTVPSIGTELADALSGGKIAPAVGLVELVDTVSFRNLDPGRTYRMNATLHLKGDDGSDLGEAQDEEGRAITASQSFTPAEADGQVEVTFTFQAPNLAGKEAVAFEELTRNDIAYAVHADISDEAQTVTFPEIGTTLANSKGEKAAKANATVELVDTVEYRNLDPEGRYTLIGTLHLVDGGEDLGEFHDASGNPALAKTEFTPGSPEGSTTVAFKVDTTGIGEKKLVAFEVLTAEDGTVVASHEDAADEGQTVVVDKPTEPDEPEPETPEKPEKPEKEKTPVTPAPKNPTTPSGSPTPTKASTMPRTGDSLPLFALVLVPSALAGLGLAYVAVRHMTRKNPVHVQRGPQRPARLP